MHTCLRSTCFATAIALCAPVAANTFDISPNTSSGNFSTFKWYVSIDGAPPANNPDLTVLTGQTYTFNVTTSISHPFWIDQSAGIGGTNAYPYPGDLSDNGVSSSTSITFNVPIDAPGTLYYACGQHFSMIGTIQVVHDLVFRDRFDL